MLPSQIILYISFIAWESLQTVCWKTFESKKTQMEQKVTLASHMPLQIYFKLKNLWSFFFPWITMK